MLESGQGLYHPSFEHDACGIGFVASIKGIRSHQHISDALTVELVVAKKIRVMARVL
jgi:glutamate synthase (NADPH) large chain